MSIETLRSGYADGKLALKQPVSWLLLTVAAYVFLAPNVDFTPGLTWHDGQRLGQLTVLALLVLSVAVPVTYRAVLGAWSALPRHSRMAVGIALALGLASALQAPLPRWALLDWGLLLLLIMLSLCIAASRRVLSMQADAWLVLLFFATASAYAVTTCSVYGAMLLVGPSYGQGFNIRELYTGFSNVRFFGHVQTMLLPFLLLPAMWWGATRTSRVLWWIVPTVWWMLVVGSGTRGTWAALLAGVITAVMFGGDAGRRWAKWQGAGLGAGLLCYAVFVLGIPQLMDLPVSFLHRAEDIISLSRREILWATALDFVMQHPLLGIGPMHYAYWANEVAAHPHNAILQWLAEWGVPAGLLLTGMWAAGGIFLAMHVRRAAGQDEDRARLFRAALLAALAGASAQAMVDGVLVMPVSQILLALLAGWALGMMPYAQPVNVPADLERMLVVLVVLFAAAVVACGVAPEIGDLAARQQAYLAGRDPNTVLLPRFWALGWISP